MKQKISGGKYIFPILLLLTIVSAKDYKPYVLAAETSQSISEISGKIEAELRVNNFELIGSYSPAGQEERLVLVITSSDLTAAVDRVGGLAGFAGVLRIGFTQNNSVTEVSYTNPTYLGYAYYGKNFHKVKDLFDIVKGKLDNVFRGIDGYRNTEFGMGAGLSEKNLQKYHYMFGMEYFDDVVSLNSFDNYADAIRTVDSSLAVDKPDVQMVYKLEYPGKNLCLYGVALSGKTGEKHFLPIIDIGSPRHTAFLPYEILVNDDEIVMLHGRYRIALAFPDLTMMTFGKIMSTPGDIETLMRSITE